MLEPQDDLICPNGHALDPDDAFCSRCGEQVVRDDPQSREAAIGPSPESDPVASSARHTRPGSGATTIWWSGALAAGRAHLSLLLWVAAAQILASSFFYLIRPSSPGSLLVRIAICGIALSRMGTVRRIDLAWLSLAYGAASLVAAALLGPLVWTTLGYTFRPEVPHLANLAAWFALPAYVAVGFALWPPTRQRMRPLTKRPFRAASVLGIGLAALALPATIWTYGEMPASPGFRRDLGPPGNKYGSYSLQSVVKMACGSDLGESLGGNLYAYVSLTGTGDLIQLTYPRGYVDLDTGEGLAICPGEREVAIPRGPIPLYMDDAALTTEDAATRMILWFSCAEKWDLPGMTVGDRDAYGWPLIDRGLKVGYGDLDQSNPDDPVIRCSPN